MGICSYGMVGYVLRKKWVACVTFYWACYSEYYKGGKKEIYFATKCLKTNKYRTS